MNILTDRNTAVTVSDETNQFIEGRNAVTEAIKSGRNIDKIYIAAGKTDATINRIASLARSSGIVVVTVDRKKLDALSITAAHQGVIASVSAAAYCTLEDILENAKKKNEAPLILICDEISDPHNLGAMLRTAECSGVHGVIVPKRRSSGLTAVVAKASAGAVEYIPIARVSNLTAAIHTLQDNGIWVFGAAADGDRTIYQADFRGPSAIVIGSEGNGISRLVSEACDFRIGIPMKGQISSLNASVAAAVILYEALRQRSN